jgi:hypothetical protein
VERGELAAKPPALDDSRRACLLVKETKRARVKTPAIRAVLQKALKNTALITVKQRSSAGVHPARSLPPPPSPSPLSPNRRAASTVPFPKLGH